MVERPRKRGVWMGKDDMRDPVLLELLSILTVGLDAQTYTGDEIVWTYK